MKELLNALFNYLDARSWLKTINHHTALVCKELSEIPLDIWFLLVVGIILFKHIVKNASQLMVHIPSLEALLFLEILEQGVSIIAVNLHLLETREFSSIVELAELMYRLVGTGSLLPKLVAREVKNLKSLAMIFLIEFFQFLILRSKSALNGCVDYEQHFWCILLKSYALSFSVLDREIKNSTHFLFFV